MRQEVQATVVLTYDADCRLSTERLRNEIEKDIRRLHDADSDSKVELQRFTVLSLKEEAEIYGNK
jgi:hypothetical protein